MRVRKSRAGLVWVELMVWGGEKDDSELNPEGVGETASLFEVLQADVVKYERKVLMWDLMQELDWEQKNIQIVMGRGCWSW